MTTKDAGYANRYQVAVIKCEPNWQPQLGLLPRAIEVLQVIESNLSLTEALAIQDAENSNFLDAGYDGRWAVALPPGKA